jgi:hypothetical protein
MSKVTLEKQPIIKEHTQFLGTEQHSGFTKGVESFRM